MGYSLIDDVIIGSDAQRQVTRRPTGTRTGGRYDPGVSFEALLRADIQTRGENLDRQLQGDRSQGQIDIFVTLEQLANAEAVDNPGVPLGWTELNLAPADYTQGPPGDIIVFDGRRYEVISESPYDEPGPLLPPTRNYIGEDRGAA